MTFALRAVAMASAGVIGVLISQIELSSLALRYPAALHAQREGLRVQVTPSTLTAERRQTMRLKATHDFDESCSRVDATIPGLAWEQSLTRKELFDGVDVQVNPIKTGQFQILFRCESRALGSASISVILPSIKGRPTRVLRWVLSAGIPIYEEQSFLSFRS